MGVWDKVGTSCASSAETFRFLGDVLTCSKTNEERLFSIGASAFVVGSWAVLIRPLCCV